MRESSAWMWPTLAGMQVATTHRQNAKEGATPLWTLPDAALEIAERMQEEAKARLDISKPADANWHLAVAYRDAARWILREYTETEPQP